MTRTRFLVVVIGISLWAGAVWLATRAGHALVLRGTQQGPGTKAAPTEGPVSASTWTAAEREAIGRATRKGFRPAVRDDAEPSSEREDLVALYGAYHPYFVRGDLDGDGRLDFVQAFVREGGPSPVFDVAVFLGVEGGGYAPPIFVEEGIAIGAGDLAIDRTILIITPDLGTDESHRFRFEPGSRKFVDVDAAAGEDAEDSPDLSPDQRPRARV